MLSKLHSSTEVYKRDITPVSFKQSQLMDSIKSYVVIVIIQELYELKFRNVPREKYLKQNTKFRVIYCSMPPNKWTKAVVRY